MPGRRAVLITLAMTVLIMVSSQARDDWFAAAKSGDTAKVRRTLGANHRLVHSADRNGMTALHYASQAGSAPVVTFLLERGANPNAGDKLGSRPLHEAAAYQRIEVARVLLAHKADCNAEKNDGVTPLMVAASYGFRDVIDLLIENGADTEATDAKGRTALTIAQSKGNVEVISSLQQTETPIDGPGQIAFVAGAIRVVALDAGGRPVAGAVVSTGDRQQSVTTDASGVAVLSDLSAGMYSVSITKQGYRSDSQPPAFVVDGETTEVEVTLQALTGTIVGTVVGKEGAGVARITVAASNGAVGVTDVSGRYTIHHVPEGIYTVTARRNGKDLATTPNVMVAAGQISNVNIVLPAGFPIGTVLITMLILVQNATESFHFWDSGVCQVMM